MLVALGIDDLLLFFVQADVQPGGHHLALDRIPRSCTSSVVFTRTASDNVSVSPAMSIVPGNPMAFGGRIAWSPDGHWLAFTVEGTLFLRNLELPSEDRVFPALGDVTNLAWDPESQRLALSISGPGFVNTQILDVAGGQKLRPPIDYPYSPFNLTWSPQGDRWASHKWDNVLVWDSNSGRQLFSIASGVQSTPSWSPDGKCLAFCGDGLVKVCDASAGYAASPPPPARDGPKKRDHQADEAHRLGLMFQQFGRHAEAEEDLERAISEWESLIREDVQVGQLRSKLVQVWIDKARLLHQNRRPAEAEVEYHRALAILEESIAIPWPHGGSRESLGG